MSTRRRGRLVPRREDHRPAERRARGRLLRRLLLSRSFLVVASVVVALLLAEGMTRLATHAMYPRYRLAEIIRLSSAIVAENTVSPQKAAPGTVDSQSILHPYFGWTRPPKSSLSEWISRERLDDMGVDSPEWLHLRSNNWGFACPHDFPYLRKKDDYVVVVLGGSVACWFCLQGGNVFCETLRELHPDLAAKNVVILNCALGGYKQPQQVMILGMLLTYGGVPDAVINIDGFNEAALGNLNCSRSVSPEFPSSGHWAHLLTGVGSTDRVIALMAAQYRAKEGMITNARRALAYAPLSNLAAAAFMKESEKCRVKVAECQNQYQAAVTEDAPKTKAAALRGPSGRYPPAQQTDALVRSWLECSRTLSDICRGRRIHYMHVLQPTLTDDTPVPSKIYTPEEIRISGSRPVWAKGANRCYPKFRENRHKLDEAGIHFADLSYLFASISEPIYYDVCHFNQHGNELFVRSIAEHFVAGLSGAE